MKAIRWAGRDEDRYFGPFTFAKERGWRFAVMLGSGDGDDYPGCRLRVSVARWTMILALPPILKPARKWHDTTNAAWNQGKDGPQGYWETEEREYGFSSSDGALHVHYGAQWNEWPGCQSKVFFYPWRTRTMIRHTLYGLEGQPVAELPARWKLEDWDRRQAIKDTAPTVIFDFQDFDGEWIQATTMIEEREYHMGEGRFKWLRFFTPRQTFRSLEINFSAETGKRKGSWKGGTVGHSIHMRPGELHEAAFRRYCHENNMKYLCRSAEEIR
jgi:hypothetical protein